MSSLERVSNHYHHLVFGERAIRRQQRDGGWAAYGRQTERPDEGPEPLDTREKAIIRGVDQFHIGTITESGWPYIQYRSGPKGFLQVLDDHTLGFADFAGNHQYVTASNLDNDDRVTLFIVDYPNRQRIKLFGRAITVEADEDPELLERLRRIGSIEVAAICERSVLIRVEAFDWNCTRSIIPRFDKQYLSDLSDVYRRKAEEREAKLLDEITELKAQLADARGHQQRYKHTDNTDNADEHHAGIVMSDAVAGDAAELLVLQRCCWVAEAIANRTFDIPALHEDIATVRGWVDSSLVVIARRHHRLVGAVRGSKTGSTWQVGRLMVAPDLAGHGVGRRLLELIESRAPADCTTFSLFTGARSERKLRMYTRAGYTPQTTGQDDGHPHISGVVFLTKQR